MKTIPLKNFKETPELVAEASKVLQDGGLVCLPCSSSYRIVADLTSEQAVNRLLQSKRRTRTAPSLVFVDSQKMLSQVASDIDPVAERLATVLWPGYLTILFDANPKLPEKVIKQLVKANGKIGVRIPESSLVTELVSTFGRPILVSSANREKKHGESSPAQVRKNFVSRVDLFIDAGDLQAAPSSTVVSVDQGKVVVTRLGSISEEQIAQKLAS